MTLWLTLLGMALVTFALSVVYIRMLWKRGEMAK